MLNKSIIKKIKIPSCGNISFLKIKDKKFFLINTKNSIQKYIYVPSFVQCQKQNDFLILSLTSVESAKILTFNNLFSSLLNWFKSLEKPWKKKLILKGLGFRSSFNSSLKILELKLGFSHLINLHVNFKDISVISNKTKIVVEGFDKSQVGNFAHKIRSLKPSDAYKGKGFWYKNEIKKFKEVKKT